MNGYGHTRTNMDGNASAYATKPTPNPSKDDSCRPRQIAPLSGALDDGIDYR